MEKHIEEKCGKEVVVDIKTIENKNIWFGRNCSETERIINEFSDYTRVGFGSTEAKYDEYINRPYWHLCTKDDLINFINESVKNEEIFSEIALNETEYAFCYLTMKDDSVSIHYEYELK